MTRINYSPHHDQGESYAELIALAEQGHQVPETRLISAKHREDHQGTQQSEAEQVAADLAAAVEKAEQNRADHDAEHLPILTDLIAELKTAEQARADEYPDLVKAQQAFNKAKNARDAKYKEIRSHVSEHYGEMQTNPDGESIFNTYIGGIGSVIVDGEIVRPNGVTESLEG